MLEAKLKGLDVCLRFLCLDRDELFVHLLREKGFSLEDLNGLKKQAKSETLVTAPGWRDYPIVNPEFDKDDIRSRIKIGWYAFAGGHFSPKKDAFPNCQGVVGFINDDLTAKEGNRVKVVLRRQKDMIEWCEKGISTNVTDYDNGRENTRRLLEFGKAHGIKFPAMGFAQGYNYDGVKAGEAYVPARDELKELSKNFKAIDDALRQIGSSFNDCYWSSTEGSYNGAWYVNSGYGSVYCYGKGSSTAVSCLLAY